MAANEHQARLLTPGEVAEQLSVSTQTLWRWRKAGTGPAFVTLGDSTVRYLPLSVTILERYDAVHE